MSDLIFTKQEFTRQLFQLIVSGVYEGIDSIYKASESLCEIHKQPTKVLMTFQNLLSAIPKWINEENREKLEKECRRILDKSNCEDYIDELLTAVFISYVKSITSVRNTNGTLRITFETPTFETFLYRVYVYSAREIWKNPTIFRKSKSSEENHKNTSMAQSIIEQAIIDVIRNSIPLKKILKECFNEDEMCKIDEVPKLVESPKEVVKEVQQETVKEALKETVQETDIKPIVFNAPTISEISDNESETSSISDVKCINLKDDKVSKPITKTVPLPVPEVQLENKIENKVEPKRIGFLLPDDLESVASDIFNDVGDSDNQSAISFEEIDELRFKTDNEPFEFEIHPDDASGVINIRK